RHPRFAEEALAANLALVELVEQVAADHDATAAQVALAWVLGQGDDVVPIPGTTRPQRIDENVAALDLALGDDEMARLDHALDDVEVAGTRYPEPMMRFLET